jgi:hypothetical protein
MAITTTAAIGEMQKVQEGRGQMFSCFRLYALTTESYFSLRLRGTIIDEKTFITFQKISHG